MQSLSNGLLFPSVPFLSRVGLLTCVAAIVAVGEVLVRGRKANRWWEYLLVLGGGVAGGLIGATLDVVTSTISPEYFAFGKALGSAAGLTQRAALLGAQAGLVAGIVATGTMLIAMRPSATSRRLATVRMAKCVTWIAGATASAATVTGCLAWLVLRPHPLSRDDCFTVAWVTHLAAYVGAALAVVGVGWTLARARRQGSRRAT